MPRQALQTPKPALPKQFKYDPIEAIAILTGFTVKYQGGPRVKQESAALIAVSLLKEGLPAIAAINSAVKKVMQAPLTGERYSDESLSLGLHRR